jgi:hypothetical protein
MTTTPATWSDFTDAELVRLISFLADDVEFATCATDAHAAERQHAAIDRLHLAALEQHKRREAAAVELDARLAMIKSWMPITIGGDTGQTGTIVIEREVSTRKIVKAKTYLWSRGEGVGPSVGRWADLLTEHWFLPAREDQREHARTVDTLQLGEWLDTGMYVKGSTLHTAAIEELYDRAVFEASAREQSDDPWTQGVLAAADAWNRPWPGERV